MVLLQNESTQLAFSKANGAILQISDTANHIDYILTDMAIPFELDYGEGFKFDFMHFNYTIWSDSIVDLQWEFTDGNILKSQITLKKGGVSFSSEFICNSNQEAPTLIKYPLLQGIQKSSSDKPDYLLHPYATGALVKHPFTTFSKLQDGFSKMPYPESYSGCSMQFLTYYAQNWGGIYIAALDGNCNVKWLNFYKEDSSFTFSHIYGYTTKASYPIVFEFLSGENSWYEAADKYREWAVLQDWCIKGRLVDLDDNQKPVWLLEKIGVATFGINAMHDRTLWLNNFSQKLKTPIFHITGPDWPKETQDFHNHLCGGYEDWFPTRFNQKNLKTMHENGDYFAPFEFDFFANLEGADSENLKKSQMINPEQKYSLDHYPFTILCPLLPYTHKLHRDRDLRVQKESGCDALYYDISANNLLHLCVNPEHQQYHTSGANRDITLGFRDIFQETKTAVSIQANKYIPAGTELINEVFLAQLDYYQARAWAQPCSNLETMYFRDWIKSGALKIVPAFTYIYHEYGGIRLDGWGKLTDDTGTLFYNTVAKTYLWGGLFELNYEYSPLESIKGEINSAEEHYFSFTPRFCPFSERKAAYLSQYAALRTGIGNKYLAYGKMCKPLTIPNTKTMFSYFQYNSGQEGPEYEDRGFISEDTVLHSVWEYSAQNEHNVALFFANTSEDNYTLSLELPCKYHNYKTRILFSDFTPDKECNSTILSADRNKYTLQLGGHQVYLLQLS